jgi:hypothetical protein
VATKRVKKVHWRRKKETCVARTREGFVPGSKIESQSSLKKELILRGRRFAL